MAVSGGGEAVAIGVVHTGALAHRLKFALRGVALPREVLRALAFFFDQFGKNRFGFREDMLAIVPPFGIGGRANQFPLRLQIGVFLVQLIKPAQQTLFLPED